MTARQVTPRPPYSALFAPLTVGRLMLANRVVMGAMHTRLETLDRPAERLTAFYRERARGGVGLILTGGVSPNPEGRMEVDAPVLDGRGDDTMHAAILAGVRGTATKICLQILHAGRYAKIPECVAPSSIRSRINAFVPRALSTDEAWRTIGDFVRTAKLAQQLGYDGIEIMGSEGYLINEFTAPATNQRSDCFGGSFEGRVRFPLEILRKVRAAVGDGFLVIYRISVLDLVAGGMDGRETARFAALVAEAGADLLNTGFGWHESRVPTVAHVVPRAGWSYAVRAVKKAVAVPVIASNRINDPQVANDLIEEGAADLVSMARPFLADPDFLVKARRGEPEAINTCIACNQACLDRIFSHQSASCLVNPRAGREIEFSRTSVGGRRIGVVGGGAAGMAFALNAAEGGHDVTLYEAESALGGQLRMARMIPEKTEFDEMLRYFRGRLTGAGVRLRLGCRVSAPDLLSKGYDDIVVATGVRPRQLNLPGIEGPNVLSYPEVLIGGRPVGRRVAIIGAGGIAFDMVEFLLGQEPHQRPTIAEFAAEFELDLSGDMPGGLSEPASRRAALPRRRVTMLQRSTDRFGARLAMTTGWIRRARAQRWGVEMLGGVTYERIDGLGLHVKIGGERRVIPADTVIVCAGQESERTIVDELKSLAPHRSVAVIGGADKALELDAMRAIDQATRLASSL